MKRRVYLIGLIILISACRTVNYVPDYDADLANQIEATSKKIDLMYLGLIDASEDDDIRLYSANAKAYLEIEVELNSILRRNKYRQKNEESIKVSENTLELWRRYKSRHKTSGRISDVDLKLNMSTMSNQMYLLMISENKKRLFFNL